MTTVVKQEPIDRDDDDASLVGITDNSMDMDAADAAIRQDHDDDCGLIEFGDSADFLDLGLDLDEDEGALHGGGGEHHGEEGIGTTAVVEEARPLPAASGPSSNNGNGKKKRPRSMEGEREKGDADTSSTRAKQDCQNNQYGGKTKDEGSSRGDSDDDDGSTAAAARPAKRRSLGNDSVASFSSSSSLRRMEAPPPALNTSSSSSSSPSQQQLNLPSLTSSPLYAKMLDNLAASMWRSEQTRVYFERHPEALPVLPVVRPATVDTCDNNAQQAPAQGPKIHANNMSSCDASKPPTGNIERHESSSSFSSKCSSGASSSAAAPMQQQQPTLRLSVTTTDASGFFDGTRSTLTARLEVSRRMVRGYMNSVPSHCWT